MRDAWIGARSRLTQVQFIAIGDGFTLRHEKDRMVGDALRLQARDVAAVIGGGIEAHRHVGALVERVYIQFEHFLAKHHALAGTQGFAPFLSGKISRGQCRLWELVFGESWNSGILVLKRREDAIPFESGSGVIPGDGLDRRLIEVVLIGDVGAGNVALHELAIGFYVPLLDATEATKLSLDPIEVAVMVTIGAGKLGLAPFVTNRDFFDAMDWEGQLGDPGCSGLLILQIKLGGRSIRDLGFAAEVVDGLDEQMRFLPAHEVDIADGAARVARQGGRPDEAGGAVAKQIDRGHGRQVVDAREGAEDAPFAPGIAGLVEVELHALATEVQDIDQAGAIDICEANAALIEHVGRIEPGRLVHSDLGAEAAVPQIGPVANFSIAYAHEVGQAIS